MERKIERTREKKGLLVGSAGKRGWWRGRAEREGGENERTLEERGELKADYLMSESSVSLRMGRGRKAVFSRIVFIKASLRGNKDQLKITS